MVIFLPNEVDDLEDLEEKLTAEKIDEAISEIRPRTEVNVLIPKFKITHYLSLTPVLEDIGQYRSPLCGFCDGYRTLWKMRSEKALLSRKLLRKFHRNIRVFLHAASQQ